MTNLMNILIRAGKSVEQYRTSDGSCLLLLPYGGRVLGLYPPGSDENFFWTDPALNSPASAKSYYKQHRWHNSGGDRTWLAPEIDVFFPDYPDTTVYRVPVEIDPGNYSVVRTNDTVRLTSPFIVMLSRSHAEVRGRITKSWEPAPNPLRYHDSLKALADITYAGYTQWTSLELLGDSNDARVALWNLLALPYGGEAFISTYQRTEPKFYSPPVDSADLIVTNHLVRFRMCGAGLHKIGVSAVSSTGRIGALYPARDNWALVVRNFAVNPSGEYLDTPWNDPVATRDLAYSTQVCRINNELGTYCELEYHATGIGFGTAQRRSDDISETWAFRGSKNSMQTLARILISADV